MGEVDLETRVRMYRWLVWRALAFTAVATPVMWVLLAAGGIWLPVLLRRTVRDWAERHHPW